jgi:oligopeptide transport system substrate-binding protein
MLRAIYIDVDINQSDIAVHYHRLQEQDYDLGGAGWIGDFNDATNFLDLLRSDSANNYGKYNNPKFDALLDKAQMEADPKTRGRLLAEAEQMAMNDVAVIPTVFPRTTELVRPYVKGWIPNIRDINRTRFLWIDKRQ